MFAGVFKNTGLFKKIIIFKVKRAISGHSGGRSDTLTGELLKAFFVFP